MEMFGKKLEVFCCCCMRRLLRIIWLLLLLVVLVLLLPGVVLLSVPDVEISDVVAVGVVKE